VELSLHSYIGRTLMASWFTEHGDGFAFLLLGADDGVLGLDSWPFCVSVVSNLLTHSEMHVRGSGSDRRKKAASRALPLPLVTSS
jgi:hypothetical protein